MSKYICPVCDKDGAYVMHCTAKSIQSAEDKFARELCETYDLDDDVVTSWHEYVASVNSNNINTLVVGDIYDLEEF